MAPPKIMNNELYESWWRTVYEDDIFHSRNKIIKPSKNKSIKASKNNGVNTNEQIFDEKQMTDFYLKKTINLVKCTLITKSLEREDIVKTLNNQSVSF